MSLPHDIHTRPGRSGYYTRWYDQHRKNYVWRRLATTMPLARRALALLQHQLTTGQTPCGRALQIPATLELWYRQHYLPDYLATPTRWNVRQRELFSHYILPEFGRYRLSSITLYHAQSWYTALLSRVARKTANLAATCLKTSIRRALAGGFIPAPPPDALAARLHDFKLRPNPRYIPRHISREQISALSLRLPEPHRSRIILWICSGLRLAEMQHLQWSDIDLRAAKLYIRSKPAHTLKDYEDRAIDLPAQVIAALQPIHARLRPSPADLFWPAPRHGGVYVKLTRAVSRICERAGVPAITPQIIRHTFASILLSDGCSLAEVKRYMGHSSIKTTEQHYAHFIPGSRSGIHHVQWGIDHASPQQHTA